MVFTEKMLEVGRTEASLPASVGDAATSTTSTVETNKSHGPLTISLSTEDLACRNSRSTVLKRLSEALLRRSLAKIDLSQRGLQASDARLVRMALSQNTNLTVLKLGYNNLGDVGVTTLAAGISMHESLGLLDLGFNNFGDEGAKALGKAIGAASQAFNGGTLHTLYLAGNLIGEDGALAMADFIRNGSCLQKLYMTGNRIGANGVRSITDGITEDEIRKCATPSREALDFSSTESQSLKSSNNYEGMQELYLGGTGIGSSGCQAVARLMERTTRIRVLSLPNCDIGDEEIGILSASIRSNKARLPVESIQLSFNKITHRGLEALSNGLWGSATLKELRLDNNEIGDRGAHQVAAILPTLKALTTLDVGFNRIKAGGLNHLMKAVVDIDQIESLSLSGNEIDVPAAKAVAYTLAYNQRLKSIFLVHCSINHEGKRHITAGAVSNAHTLLRNLTGFAIGPVVVTLGFPEALQHWNNEQVMNFINLMYKKRNNEKSSQPGSDEKEMDPLNFLPANDEKDIRAIRSQPLEASVVVEIATRTYENLLANGVDVFSRKRGNKTDPLYGSPLASDTMLIENGASALSINGKKETTEQSTNGQGEGMPTTQARSFVAVPESQANAGKVDAPDPIRKKRIVEWLCLNIQHLNELSQLQFSPRELWRLHQHYFTPVVNESGGSMGSARGGTISSVPEGIKGYTGSEIAPSFESCVEDSPVNDPATSSSPTAPASLPLLKRKVSYRFLGDAEMTSHQSRVEPKIDNLLQNVSVSKLIECGHTGHSLPPKNKKARRNRTRISFVPRIKAKLDSYMDVCHEKALITMRQLYFVEQAILKGQVNPLEPCLPPRIHLSGRLATEAEMIIVDMI